MDLYYEQRKKSHVMNIAQYIYGDRKKEWECLNCLKSVQQTVIEGENEATVMIKG